MVRTSARTSVECAPLDDALLSDLTCRYVDMDGTRERIARRLAADRARVADTLVQAGCAVSPARDRYQRVQRAFQDGAIEAEDWAEQRRGLVAEREAAGKTGWRWRTRGSVSRGGRAVGSGDLRGFDYAAQLIFDQAKALYRYWPDVEVGDRLFA